MPRSLSALATNNSRPTHPLHDVLGALCRLDEDGGCGGGGDDDDGGGQIIVVTFFFALATDKKETTSLLKDEAGDT